MNTALKRATQFRLAALLILFPFLVSCANFAGPGYYTQLTAGEIHILLNSTPIPAILNDKQAPEELKKNLRSVLEMREFAIRELGLPANESFTAYMDIGREFVTWSLTATPEFSMQPKIWCFPFSGCSSHLTFFSEQAAERYEKKLAQQGYDVSVRGVIAYSTNGNFDDPVMNTLFDMPDYLYVTTVFHEMAHEKLHIQNESNFNESFAVFVGRTGQYLWTKKHYGDEFAKQITERNRRAAEFAKLVTATWNKLNALYMKNLAPEETRLLKQGFFQKMKEYYVVLKEGWGGYGGYDEWFKKPMNNARVSETNDYGNLVPIFEKLFEFSGRDFRYFYQQTDALAKLSPLERKREIRKILDEPRP
jgi:predicted aminopeptidase